MLLWSYEKESKQISSESTNYNNILVIFVGIALKLEKIAHHFPIHVICSERQKETISMPKINNKTGPLFLKFIFLTGSK